MKIEYSRVSTDEQNLDLQRQALEAAGCEKIFEDRRVGAAGVVDSVEEARRRGKRLGRPVKVTPEKLVHAEKMNSAGREKSQAGNSPRRGVCAVFIFVPLLFPGWRGPSPPTRWMNHITPN